MPEIVQPTKEQ
jgi:hypothetical protein